MRVVRPAIQLIIGGEEYQVDRFDYRAPEGILSAAVNVKLSNNVTDVDVTKKVVFKIGYKDEAGNVSWSKVIRNGRIIHNNHGVAHLNDKREISIINPLADSWEVTPNHPIKLYDPNRTSVSDEERLDYYAVLTEAGDPIRTEIIQKPGFNLMQALTYVFKDKLGFAGVVTNIPNYSIIELSISMAQSYYSSIRVLYDFFNPEVVVDENDVVFIIDPLAPLPPGLPIKKLAAGDYEAAEKEKPVERIVNSLLLSYNQLDLSQSYVGPVTTRVVNEPPMTSGVLGHKDWHQQLVTKVITELHNDVTDVTRITGELETTILTKVYGFTNDGPNTLLSEEVQEDTYSPDFKLKTGHKRTVSQYLRLPGVSYGLVPNVVEEVNQTQWARSVWNPNEFIKVWSSTSIRGLVLAEGELTESELADPYVRDDVTLVSIITANRLRIVSAEDTGDQQVFMREISSEIEYWRETGGGQVDVYVSKIDKLNHVVESSHSINHIADVRVGENDERHIVKTRFIVNQDSVDRFGLRAPIQVNAGEVPYNIALEVAKRRLARSGAPSRKAKITMVNYDLGVRRGTLKKLKLRNDQHEVVFITGIQINGDRQSNNKLKVSQSLDGIVIDA